VKKRLGSIESVRGTKASDLPFDERLVQAADAGHFADREDAPDRGLLLRVHEHEIPGSVATEQPCQFEIGRQTEAAGERVARLRPGFDAVGERHRFQMRGATRANRPGGAIGNSA
jgi:hypothetical protein